MRVDGLPVLCRYNAGATAEKLQVLIMLLLLYVVAIVTF